MKRSTRGERVMLTLGLISEAESRAGIRQWRGSVPLTDPVFKAVQGTCRADMPPAGPAVTETCVRLPQTHYATSLSHLARCGLHARLASK